MKTLKIVVLGTPDFAVATLDAIHKSNHEVIGVVTMPDKPAGRGQKLQSSAMKKYAVDNELKVLQPENLKEESFIEELKSLQADLFIVVAFRMLPEVVWNMPPLGTINLHGSLLPDYRGAAPINWAVMNGDKETGVSTFQLKHAIDTGDILLQDKTPIGPNDNVGVIHDKLMEIGARLVVKTIDEVASQTITSIPQEKLVNSSTRKAPKIFKPDCLIKWNTPSQTVHNHIRGLSPYPAAYTVLFSKEEEKELNMKIYTSLISDKKLNPGKILIEEGRIFIGTIDNAVEVTNVHLAGKKRMDVKSLLNGFKLDQYCIK